MVGLAVVLVISWLVLHYFYKLPITAIGITPNKQRLKECLVGFSFMALMALINFSGQAYFKEISYAVNSDYSVLDLLGGSFWIIKAVLLEELVFRGVLLYLLIKYLGIIKACLLSSIVFGIYHWFSYEVFGSRLILMIYVFLVTGAGGWMFAFAYAKTQSLYAPFGLHLGWNITSAVVFSAGPIGTHWLIPQGEPIDYGGWITLVFFILQTLIAPGLVTWYLQTKYLR